MTHRHPPKKSVHPTPPQHASKRMEMPATIGLVALPGKTCFPNYGTPERLHYTTTTSLGTILLQVSVGRDFGALKGGGGAPLEGDNLLGARKGRGLGALEGLKTNMVGRPQLVAIFFVLLPTVGPESSLYSAVGRGLHLFGQTSFSGRSDVLIGRAPQASNHRQL